MGSATIVTIGTGTWHRDRLDAAASALRDVLRRAWVDFDQEHLLVWVSLASAAHELAAQRQGLMSVLHRRDWMLADLPSSGLVLQRTVILDDPEALDSQARRNDAQPWAMSDLVEYLRLPMLHVPLVPHDRWIRPALGVNVRALIREVALGAGGAALTLILAEGGVLDRAARVEEAGGVYDQIGCR
ncbi:MAG: hypothetical protein R3B49_10765 [Phycisphaerales bacterium]